MFPQTRLHLSSRALFSTSSSSSLFSRDIGERFSIFLPRLLLFFGERREREREREGEGNSGVLRLPPVLLWADE